MKLYDILRTCINYSLNRITQVTNKQNPSFCFFHTTSDDQKSDGDDDDDDYDSDFEFMYEGNDTNIEPEVAEI